MFICVDGIDGCGKSSVARDLTNRLIAYRKEVMLVAEPTYRGVGSVIREILSGHRSYPGEREMSILFAADRAIHLNEVVLPALAAGKFVVCERGIATTYAYQARTERDAAFVTALHETMKRPNILFLLNVSVETAMSRVEARKVADLYEKREILEAVKRRYDDQLDFYRAELVEPVYAEVPFSEVCEYVWDRVCAHVR